MRSYVGKQQRVGKAKDPETIEISAVFRKPVRPAEDAAFRRFPIKRASDVVVCDRRFRAGPFDGGMLENPETVEGNAGARSLERSGRRLIETFGNGRMRSRARVSLLTWHRRGYRILRRFDRRLIISRVCA